MKTRQPQFERSRRNQDINNNNPNIQAGHGQLTMAGICWLLEWWRDSCVSGRRKRLACRKNWCFALTFDLTEVNRRKMMYCWLLSYPAVLPGCGTTGTGNWGLGLCHRATRNWNLIGLELVCLENWMGQYQFFWRWIACAWLVAKLDTCMAKANKKILRKLGYFWLKSLKLNLPHPPTPYMLELI